MKKKRTTLQQEAEKHAKSEDATVQLAVSFRKMHKKTMTTHIIRSLEVLKTKINNGHVAENDMDKIDSFLATILRSEKEKLDLLCLAAAETDSKAHFEGIRQLKEARPHYWKMVGQGKTWGTI